MTYMRNRLVAAAACLVMVPGLAVAEIIWKGDFSTGNFLQYHRATTDKEVTFGLVPNYGSAIQYGGQIEVGDGSLLSLVSVDGRTVNGIKYPIGPTRGAPYAAKFTVKNSASGSEPADCDGSVCTRRRTELSMQATMMDYYNGLPYMSERWASVSVFIPSDWQDGGSGWGPVIYNIKPRNEAGGGGSSSAIAIGVRAGGYWTITHRWSPEEKPAISEQPWQYQMFYTGNEGGAPYPRSNNWPDGMVDFPDVETSHAALRSFKKGAWTDWVLHVRFDERGAADGGTGFLTVWKREDKGPWIKVLHILPNKTTRGGMTFDHGIGYRALGGYGPKLGMYMEKAQVWDLPADRVLYLGNVKVGDQNATFSQMSHDGSGSSDKVVPLSPTLTGVQ